MDLVWPFAAILIGIVTMVFSIDSYRSDPAVWRRRLKAVEDERDNWFQQYTNVLADNRALQEEISIIRKRPPNYDNLEAGQLNVMS